MHTIVRGRCAKLSRKASSNVLPIRLNPLKSKQQIRSASSMFSTSPWGITPALTEQICSIPSILRSELGSVPSIATVHFVPNAVRNALIAKVLPTESPSGPLCPNMSTCRAALSRSKIRTPSSRLKSAPVYSASLTFIGYKDTFFIPIAYALYIAGEVLRNRYISFAQ